jgi:hypothetical protein
MPRRAHEKEGRLRGEVVRVLLMGRTAASHRYPTRIGKSCSFTGNDDFCSDDTGAGNDHRKPLRID